MAIDKLDIIDPSTSVQHSTLTKEQNVLREKINEIIDVVEGSELICDGCGFEAKSEAGLAAHERSCDE